MPDIPANFALTLHAVIFVSSVLLGAGLATTRLLGRRPSWMLISLFALFAAQSLGNLLYALDYQWWVLELRAVAGFAFGPLAFFYLRESALPGYRLTFLHGVHILPVWAGILSLIFAPQLDSNLYAYASAAVLVVYAFAMLVWLRAIGFFTDPDPDRKAWLIVAGGLLLLLAAINALSTNFNCRPISDPDVRFYQALLLLTTLLMLYGLVVGGFWRPFVLFPAESGLKKPGSARDAADALDQTIVAELRRWLDEAEAWRQPGLKLADLAEALQVTPRRLSEGVQRAEGYSWIDLLNARRVEAVCACLQDPRFFDQSMLDIALECGFNSKASFNRAFLKHTGQTPSAYRADQMREL